MASEEQKDVVASSEKMLFKRIEVDPGGDTLIILPQRGGAPREKPLFTTEIKPDDSGTLPEIHYLVSKKHLALASRRAQKMFAGDYKEAVPNDTDGLHHWKFDPIFDPTAFEIVIKMIHGKTRDIPRTVTIEVLAEVSVIVDDLECQDAVWFFTKGWIDQLKDGIPKLECQDLTRWILISFVFKEPDLFESSTRTAIRWSPYYIPTHNLPLRPKIVDQMRVTRKDILEKLTDGLYDLERQLLDETLGCNFTCRSMLLGTLIQGLRAHNLHSSQKFEQLSLLTLGSAIEGFEKFKWPKYYCSEEDSPHRKSSGVWTPESSYSHPYNLPRRLVCHDCGFENRVRKLFSTSETELKGLKLSDYS